jgi:hypothetical protein
MALAEAFRVSSFTAFRISDSEISNLEILHCVQDDQERGSRPQSDIDGLSKTRAFWEGDRLL